jgi:hypothetical protein
MPSSPRSSQVRPPGPGNEVRRGAARPSGSTTTTPPADGCAAPSSTRVVEPARLAIVLPARVHVDTVAVVAEYAERAVLATAPVRSVCTVLVDTAAADDGRTRAAFHNARLCGARVELTVPGVGWGSGSRAGFAARRAGRRRRGGVGRSCGSCGSRRAGRGTSVVAAVRQFLLATGTPIAVAQTTDDPGGECIARRLPATG